MGIKSFQTELGQLPILKQWDEPPEAFGASAGDTAVIGVAGELQRIQDRYSISTIEEAASLGWVNERREEGGPGDDDPVLREIAAEALAYMRQDPSQEETLQHWEASEGCEFEMGVELGDTRGVGEEDDEEQGEEPPAFGSPTAGVGTLPPNHSLIDEYMPAIRDQRARGTCVAFTALSCLEYHNNKAVQTHQLDLSEQYTFWRMLHARHRRHPDACFPDLPTHGTCEEHQWAYNPYRNLANPSYDPPPGGITPRLFCNRVQRISPDSVQATKKQLLNGRVVAIAVQMFENVFTNPVTVQTGVIRLPLVSDARLPEGHAVALVGYADDEDGFAGGGYFIVRNSWATRWASQSPIAPGYGLLPYAYLEQYNWASWVVSG